MKYLIVIALLCLHEVIYCQGTKGFQVLVTLDNDLLGIANKDENYTGGLKIELITPRNKITALPFFTFKDRGALNLLRFAVGGTAYTPQDLSNQNIVFGDRPYASLLFFSAGNTSYSPDKKWLVQSDIQAGAMGAKGPGTAQAYIHSNQWFGSTRPVPNGWSNQVGNQGAVIVNYNTRVQKYLWGTNKMKPHSNVEWLQVNVVGKLDIGNYMTNLQAGTKLSFLNLNTGILQEYNPDIMTIAPASSSSLRKKIRLYLFAEPHIRFAAYNATLEGLLTNDHSVYTIDHGDVKRILFEINVGVNLLLGDVLYLRYSFYGRSREFTNGKSFHTWAGVTVGVSPSRWNHN